jgi:hypothetical protein
VVYVDYYACVIVSASRNNRAKHSCFSHDWCYRARIIVEDDNKTYSKFHKSTHILPQVSRSIAIDLELHLTKVYIGQKGLITNSIQLLEWVCVSVGHNVFTVLVNCHITQ